MAFLSVFFSFSTIVEEEEKEEEESAAGGGKGGSGSAPADRLSTRRSVFFLSFRFPSVFSLFSFFLSVFFLFSLGFLFCQPKISRKTSLHERDIQKHEFQKPRNTNNVTPRTVICATLCKTSAVRITSGASHTPHVTCVTYATWVTHKACVNVRHTRRITPRG